MIRTVRATRYVTPLREGGSLPAIVEADDDGLYVLKFRGAGQGHRALVAELVAGEIGRALDLPIPELVFVDLDPALGRNEPDFEIKALIEASPGINLGMDYLPGAFGFDPVSSPRPDPRLAAATIWFDAYVTNVDRTARNTNILVWHRRHHLIDHGAALYFHHAWLGDLLERARDRFTEIARHVLLPFAAPLPEVDAEMASRLDGAALERILASVPQEWLGDVDLFPDVATHRAAYVAYLTRRLEAPRAFAVEAEDARARSV